MKLASTLFILSLAACATGASSTRTAGGLDSQSCSPLSARLADRGADVYAQPDSTSNVVTTFKQDTMVCAGADTEGFGFRYVKLGSGATGYVKESNLND